LKNGTHAPETEGRYDVLGADVTQAALDHAESQGVPTLRGDFLNHDFKDARFDAVTFWAVIEHLAEPDRFLAKATELLRPGGMCFILVPNLKSLAIRLLGAKYRYIMPDHVNYFAARTLRQFVEHERSLELVEVSSMHFNPIVILQDLRGGLERKADEDRARLLKKTTAMKQSPWLKPARVAYRAVESILRPLLLADNLVIVARKRGQASAAPTS
jgi:2-polyprenyl-3-methyl-5-hydroxy-6-metoxy-1,4-benzoquinol methylase